MPDVRRFEDLEVWQLAAQLRDKVVRHTATGAAARDATFRDQVRASARSAPRNLAEGFNRHGPREFAPFVRIARASLGATLNHLLDGKQQDYFKDEDLNAMVTLARRAQGAATRLLAYLESCNPNGPGNEPAEAKAAKGQRR